MNSRNTPPQKNVQRRVTVFLNDTAIEGLKPGEPLLFLEPDLVLFEEPTLFLRARYVESGTRSAPSTWSAAAYGLQSWFDFLSALGVDWMAANRDDLIAYRDGYLQAVSPKTGTVYSPGTVGTRMSTILAFHAFAGKRGWYAGNILNEVDAEGDGRAPPIDKDALAHTRKGGRTVRLPSGLIPSRVEARTSIKPFSRNEMQALLRTVGPRSTERGEDERRPSRDRLICDLGWACGLRLDEIHQLTTLKFLSLHPDPDAPVAEQAITVKGKFGKTRTIAVPNWLALDALAYIGDERKDALKAGGISGRQDRHALLLAGRDGNKPGTPIGHRRMQQIIEDACVEAGLTEMVEATNAETGEVRPRRRPKHSIHDLRHTYAVMTYWAEKLGGNTEPWKKIQAQLGHSNLATTVDTYLSYVELFGEKERLVDVRRLLGV